MSGRRLVIGFLAFLAVFAAALVWFQFFAFYERQQGVGALTIDGVVVPVAGYDGIDSDLLAAEAPRMPRDRPAPPSRPSPPRRTPRRSPRRSGSAASTPES